MKLKFLLRPTLAIVFTFIGAVIADSLGPENLGGPDYFLIVAAVAFGTLGFILPEVLEFAGRAGIAVLARQIASYIPTSPDALWAARIPLSKIRRPSFALPRRASKGKYVNPMIVDTSVLVDGRLIEIAKTGFLFGTLLILPAVVRELHKLADSADSARRKRGRRGLDELAQLRAVKTIKLEVLSREPEGETVDGKLVAAARKMRAKLLTVDFNLNKVAKISKVQVLNLNELANAAKTAVLPGEHLTIVINAPGAQRAQGVGYLPDGTMVVVEDGAELVGKETEAVVDKVLQTAAGKMVFGRLANARMGEQLE